MFELVKVMYSWQDLCQMTYHLSKLAVTFCGNQVLPAWHKVKCGLNVCSSVIWTKFVLLGSDQHENTDLEYLTLVNHIMLILVFS